MKKEERFFPEQFKMQSLDVYFQRRYSKITIAILFIMTPWCTKYLKQNQGRRVECSEQYIANILGCARESVSRGMQPLIEDGWFKRTLRKKWNGQWQTNLYELGRRFYNTTYKKFIQGINDKKATIRTGFSSFVHRVTSASHKVLNTCKVSQNGDILPSGRVVPTEEMLDYVSCSELEPKSSISKTVSQETNGWVMAQFGGDEDEFVATFGM